MLLVMTFVVSVLTLGATVAANPPVQISAIDGSDLTRFFVGVAVAVLAIGALLVQLERQKRARWNRPSGDQSRRIVSLAWGDTESSPGTHTGLPTT